MLRLPLIRNSSQGVGDTMFFTYAHQTTCWHPHACLEKSQYKLCATSFTPNRIRPRRGRERDSATHARQYVPLPFPVKPHMQCAVRLPRSTGSCQGVGVSTILRHAHQTGQGSAPRSLAKASAECTSHLPRSAKQRPDHPRASAPRVCRQTCGVHIRGRRWGGNLGLC